MSALGPPPPGRARASIVGVAAVGIAAALAAALAPAAAPALAAIAGAALGLLAGATAFAIAAQAPRTADAAPPNARGGVGEGASPRAAEAAGAPGSPDVAGVASAMHPDAGVDGAPRAAAPRDASARDAAPTGADPGAGASPTRPPPAIARPLVVDTSALIDGRLLPLLRAGWFDGEVVVPRAVLLELQRLASSQDKAKRQRGQRGLDLVEALRAETGDRLAIAAGDAAEGAVDEAVLRVARARSGRLVTTDGPLGRLALLEGLAVANLHEVALALARGAQAGERVTVTVIRPGEGPGQGLGYLEDGSPIVIEGARERVGDALPVEVTSVKRSKTGAIYFARPA